MEQNIIELGFNVESFDSQKKVVLESLIDLFEQVKKYDGTQFNTLGSGGLTELNKSLQDGSRLLTEFGSKLTDYVTKQKEATTQQKAYNDEQKKTSTQQKENISQQNEYITSFATVENTVNQNAKLLAEYRLQLQKNTDAQKLFKKELENGQITQAQYIEKTANAIQKNLEYKQSIADVTKELNNSAKADFAVPNSIGEARGQNAILTKQRDSTDVNNTEKIQELNDLINRNNILIDANSDALARQKINIGNYNGATVILKESLQSIGEKLAQMTAAGDTTSEAFQKLALEQNLLSVALEKEEAGFTSVNLEIRNLKNTIDGLVLAGLEETEVFTKLNLVYTEAKQAVNQLHESQKILTSETPTLAALSVAAQGLGGAYALGAGSAALFADGNEKVEKSINKLIAITTVLNGIEQVSKAIKDRGGIATALQLQASNLLAAAKKIEIQLFGDSGAAALADAEAKVADAKANLILVESTEGVTAAEIESATAAVGSAEAFALSEAAAYSASVGFEALRTAIITTGIGALVVAVIYGIVKLVEAINDYINADEKLLEKEKALAEATKVLFDLNKDLNDVYENGAKKQLDALEKVDAKQKAAGLNQFTQLATERDLATQRKKIADDELARLGVNQKKLDELESVRKFNAEKLIDLQKQVTDATANGTKDDIERAQKQFDANKAIVDLFKDKYDTVLGLQKTSNDEAAKLDNNAVQQTKAAADLAAQIRLDAAQRSYNDIKAFNDAVLGRDSSTEKQKLDAIASNYSAEAKLEKAHEADLTRQFNAGIIVQSDYQDKIANLQDELHIKEKASGEQSVQLIIQYRDRKAAALNDAAKTGNEIEIAEQEAITKNVQKELNARIDALKISINDKAAIIAGDFAEEIRLAKEHGKTKDEIDAIEVKQQKALVELTSQTQKDIFDIYTSFAHRKQKVIDDQNKAAANSNDVSSDYNKQVEELNSSLINQTIGYSKYIRAKRQLDSEYSIEKAQADVDDDEEALARQQDFEQNIIASKKRIADADLEKAKAGGNKTEIDNAQAAVDAIVQIQQDGAVKELEIKKKLEVDKQKLTDATVAQTKRALDFLHTTEDKLVKASFDLAAKLVDAGFERKQNQIQHEIDLQNEQSQQQIAGVQASTLAEQDKAAEVIILTAQQKARDTQLKKEQLNEQVKQARFDRDIAAAKALWSGIDAELSAVAEYGGTPYAFAIYAAIAALTAVQVATILATPIPEYAEGTDNHPGGLALVGEDGLELVNPKGGSPYLVNSPTLIDLAAGSSVEPLDASKIIYELGGISMQKSADIMNQNIDDSWNQTIWQTTRLEKAIKKGMKQQPININISGNDAAWIQAKITGK